MSSIALCAHSQVNMSQLCSVIAYLTNQYLWPSVEAPTFAGVVNEHVSPSEVVYMLNNQSSWDVCPLIRHLHQPVILANHRTRCNNKHAELWFPPILAATFTVVLCDHLWLCYHLLADQIERHLINPRERVLIQLVKEEVTGERNSSELQHLLEEIFHRFRRINLLNVVIRLGFGRQLQSFTFSPYDKSFLINLTDR